MTHLSEAAFNDYVAELCRAQFGRAAVHTQKWMAETTAYCDIWVDLGAPWPILAIELENDAESVRAGVAQALEYGQNNPRAVPVVMTPKGHVERKQVRALEAYAPVIEVAVPDGYGGPTEDTDG